MAIKNPYPNIKDGIVSDNTTWSSAKINADIPRPYIIETDTNKITINT